MWDPNHPAWPIFHGVYLLMAHFLLGWVCVSPPQGEASVGGEALVTSGTHTEMGGQRGGRWSKKPVSALRTGVTPERLRSSSLDPNTPPSNTACP